MRYRFSFDMPVAAVVAFWVIIFILSAWGVAFATGALHSSGFTFIPTLSFRQSAGVLALIFLLCVQLRARRINKDDNGR